VGIVWSEAGWDLIKSGRINGVSMQGSATRRRPSREALAALRDLPVRRAHGGGPHAKSLLVGNLVARLMRGPFVCCVIPASACQRDDVVNARAPRVTFVTRSVRAPRPARLGVPDFATVRAQALWHLA
jgi:hypothetical protein